MFNTSSFHVTIEAAIEFTFTADTVLVLLFIGCSAFRSVIRMVLADLIKVAF
jgi:hypothetical protein